MRSRSEAIAAWSRVTSVLALARTFERGGHGLYDRGELAGGERDEGHARAVGVARAARAIAVAVQRRSIGALEAVVLADDPFFHRGVLSRAPLGSPYARRRTPHCGYVSVPERKSIRGAVS